MAVNAERVIHHRYGKGESRDRGGDAVDADRVGGGVCGERSEGDVQVDGGEWEDAGSEQDRMDRERVLKMTEQLRCARRILED